MTTDQINQLHTASLKLNTKLAERQLYGADGQPKPANPKVTTFWSTGTKYLCRGNQALLSPEERAMRERVFSTSDPQLGITLGESVADQYFDQLNASSVAMRSLRVIVIEDGAKTKIPVVTGRPSFIFHTPTHQGTAAEADTRLAGRSVSAEFPTVISLVEATEEWASDAQLYHGTVLPELLAAGHGAALDHAAFAATGVDDDSDGGQTGLFAHAAVPVATATETHTTIQSLTRSDLAKAVGAVRTKALEHPCAWWAAPALLPDLLEWHDGFEYLLKPPTVAGAIAMVLNWPLFLTETAPADNHAGAPVLAFGRRDAAVVAIRKEFKIQQSRHAQFKLATWQVRAVTRAWCGLLDPASFCILKTAGA